MADRPRSIDPLRHDVPIVDATGRPTPQFMRQWMQARRVDEAVVATSDSLAGLEEVFAGHGPRHHAGGDMALDLDSIAGNLNGEKLYGDASLDNVALNNLKVVGYVRATEVGAYSDPEFDTAPAVGFEGGVARIGFSGDGTLTDAYVGRLSAGVFGGIAGTLNRADELGGSGQDSAFHLARPNHTGTQAWGTVDKVGSSLADLATRSAADLNSGILSNDRLASTVALKNAAQMFSSTVTAEGLISNRTAGTSVAIRTTISGGVTYEQLASSDMTFGQSGSARDLRQRRTAASIMNIDNNANGPAELDVTGYGLFGGSTVSAQAVLEARSTARGFLPPRMTTVQRDAISAIPLAGLTVYNTTVGKQQTWDGAAWQDHW